MTDQVIFIPIKNYYEERVFSFNSSTGTELEYLFFKGNIIEILPDQRWFWTDEWQRGEDNVDEFIKNGEIETFETMEEFLRTLPGK